MSPTKVMPDESPEIALNWQAQKSALTRDRILDATISGFIKLGYNKLSTTQVADMAGISRGAMRHHFDSKKELIQAAIEYLHQKLLEEYLENISLIPEALHGSGRALIRARLDAFWNYLNSDLNLVYQELTMTARTDPELKDSLDRSIKNFDQIGRQSVLRLFSDWEGKGERLFFIIDTSRVVLEGLIRVQWQTAANREQFIERQLHYLTLCIEQIVNDDGNTEISQFFNESE
ncbi:TetR/AcrR family transcriptional regulator [Oceanicoccus sp. KOV_DT_Chl]|uniref:TetR/AcrR family transcriptional regulator n=1 Tax=Oceanicoccus sp. KOV_DT_Chl TaxID=1904639 RepID=UPI000C7DF7D6|nr:TetR/AcrR family transcriptional regulator [Oceanicoccus sp. KOV_DT_Chl]